MKKIIIVFSLISSVCLANDRVIFEGQLENGNKDCKLILQDQNPNANMHTLKFISEDLNLKFFNKRLVSGEPKEKYKGLYIYKKKNYTPVIGVPIFPIGRYYDVEMTLSSNDIEIKMKTMLAGVLDWIQVWSKTYRCF